MKPSQYQFILTQFTTDNHPREVDIRPDKIVGIIQIRADPHSPTCILTEGGHEIVVHQTKAEVYKRIGQAHFKHLEMIQEMEEALAEVPLLHPTPDDVQ